MIINPSWENHLSEGSISRYLPSHGRISIHQLPLHLPVVEVLPKWPFPALPPLLCQGGECHIPCQRCVNPPQTTTHLTWTPFYLLPRGFNKGNDTCLAIPVSQQRVLWSCKPHCKLLTYLSDFVSLFVSIFLCSSQLVLDKEDWIRPDQPWISASMANLE